jgi:hypothetical protein
MLTYLLTIAASGLVGLGGGALGGFLASRRCGRSIDGLRNTITDVEFHLSTVHQNGDKDRVWVQSLADQLQGIAQSTATREELRGAFMQLVTRQELELALQSVVSAIAPAGALPRPPAPLVQSAADNQAELARVLANLNQQMNGINQQLGIGGN